MNIVDFAHQVLDLHERNQELERENALLREEVAMHRRDQHESLNAGEQQMAGWLRLLCSDRVKIQPLDASAGG